MDWYWYVLIGLSPVFVAAGLFLFGLASWVWHYAREKGKDDYSRRVAPNPFDAETDTGWAGESAPEPDEPLTEENIEAIQRTIENYDAYSAKFRKEVRPEEVN